MSSRTSVAASAVELAHLLRSRRDALRREDVGVPAGTRRRIPGLRREEVAQLAGISTTYYTFLEQGRELNPSRQVLDALARALRLSDHKRGHLHELALGPLPPQRVDGAAEAAADGVVALVARLDPDPAYVTGRSWDVLTSNRAARALWTDWPARPAAERNLLWWTLADPASRAVLVDWEAEAAAQLARFRAASARHRDDPAFASLVDRLLKMSPEMRDWWPRHDVAPLSSGSKRIRHPELGEMTFRHVVLTVADEPEQKLVTFTPEASDRARIATLIGSHRGSGIA